MKPYYDQDGITLYCGDCRDILPTFADKSFDLCLTSPPYNLNGASGTSFHALADGYETHTDDMQPEEYREWQHVILRAAWKVLSDGGAIFYNHKPRVGGNQAWLPLQLVPDGLPIRQIITWDRCSGHMRVPQFFCPSYEWLLMIAKPGFRLATLSISDVWRIPFETNNPHPAPFPLKLAIKAIGSTTASTILDPFCGSGTTLVAAKQLGRKATGIEISEKYCEITVKRLAQMQLEFK